MPILECGHYSCKPKGTYGKRMKYNLLFNESWKQIKNQKNKKICILNCELNIDEKNYKNNI